MSVLPAQVMGTLAAAHRDDLIRYAEHHRDVTTARRRRADRAAADRAVAARGAAARAAEAGGTTVRTAPASLLRRLLAGHSLRLRARDRRTAAAGKRVAAA